jgi:hypothetical protein
MSIPRLSSSHQLAQRLDTLLGTKLAQQLASSTRATTQDFILQSPRAELGPDPQAAHRQLEPLSQAPQRGARSPLAPQTQQAGAQQTRNLAGLAGLSGTASAPISLGSTAQLLVQLLRGFPSPAPALSQSQPLLPGAPSPQTSAGAQAAPLTQRPVPGVLTFSSPVAAALFQGLKDAVGHSGLFYESHLAQYASGRYPRVQLQMEPQAQLPPDAALKAAASPEAQALRGASAETAASVSTQTADARPAQTAPAHGALPLPPETSLLVRQQLETLAMNALQWRGEAWPQADMHWFISDDGRQGSQAQDMDGDAERWSSQLTLSLPKLGDIHARLRISGQSLSIQLAAPQSETALKAHAGMLRQQLHATGLTLSQLDIAPEFAASAQQAVHPAAPAHDSQTEAQSHD